MEHYEIQDVSNRATSTPPLVTIDVETRNAMQIFLVVENIGRVAARDVTFEFVPNLPFRKDGDAPPIFDRGISFLSPGRKYLVRYHTFPQVLDEANDIPESFDVRISYFHPSHQERVAEDFHIDLRDFEATTDPPSDIRDLGRDLVKSIGEIRDNLKQVSGSMAALAKISGASGLQVSVTTLRTIVDDVNKLPKLDPTAVDWDVFREVLGVSPEMASRLHDFFYWPKEGKALSDVEGMTDELRAEVRAKFLAPDP